MQERRKERVLKILTSRYFFVVAIVVLFLLSLGVVKKMARDYSIDSEIDRLKAEMESLQKTNNEFSEAVKYLQSDRFIEDEAREKLGMRKLGETVIIVSDDKQEFVVSGDRREFLKISGTPNAETKETFSNPKRWWRYFFQS